MFMVLSSWQSHCKSSPGSFDECRMAPSGRRPKTKPDDLGCESACTGGQKLHPPSPFIITEPESWYSFYRPMEGRRLSRPSWLVTYRDGLPVHGWMVHCDMLSAAIFIVFVLRYGRKTNFMQHMELFRFSTKAIFHKGSYRYLRTGVTRALGVISPIWRVWR